MTPSRFHVIGLCTLAMLAACGDDPAVPLDEPPPPPVWTALSGLPPATTLYALWVPREDYVIGVGPAGLILRWDGLMWSPVASDNTRPLYAVAGAAAGEIVAAGDAGVIVRFGGTQFVTVSTPTSEPLRGLWTPGGNAFVAVGGGGTILRGDGSTWTADDCPVDDALLGVWGSASDDAFAVGLNGVILHFDGAAWTPMASGTTAFLSAVGGTAPDDVYAVGGSGTILHYDGDSWTPMTSGVGDVLQGVWAGDRTVAVGGNGVILTREGGAWRAERGVTHEWLYGVARSGSQTWAVGARALLVDDGSGWKQQARGAVPSLHGVAGPPETPLRVVGDNGYVARSGAGAWVAENTGDARTLRAIWCEPDGGLFAAGINRIARFDGIGWVDEYSTPVDLRDIGGGPSGLYAVGVNATILRRIGETWVKVQPTTAIFEDLHAYASRKEDEAYIVGDDGRILAYNGVTWSIAGWQAAVDLYDVTTDVPGDAYRAVAVGSDGVIIGYGVATGNSWATIGRLTTATLRALARGPGGRLYAVGDGGAVVDFDGTRWSVVPSPVLIPLRSAWSDGGSLFVAGGGGTSAPIVLRYGAP